jgi:SP family general alpha glucoside:H+ symporter-like MFS transporter
MLSPTAWNWGAKSAFFWLATNVLCIAWCFFRLPETSGFTFAELDVLFANQTPTRKFKMVTVHGESAGGQSLKHSFG